MSERLSSVEIEKLVNDAGHYDIHVKREAKEKITQAILGAYIKADNSVWLRELLDEANIKLSRAELDRDYFREQLRIVRNELQALRQPVGEVDSND